MKRFLPAMLRVSKFCPSLARKALQAGLPAFFSFAIFIAVFLSSFQPASAQTPIPVPTISNTPCADLPDAKDGDWCPSDEVTFYGKTAVRAKNFLDWTLGNHDWVCVKRDSNGICNNVQNPIAKFWLQIELIAFYFILVVVVVGGIVLMVTRGKSVTVMKLIPRFLFVAIFVVLAFAILQFTYQVSDIIQGFFLSGPGLENIKEIVPGTNVRRIQGDNLFHIAFDYDFQGNKRIGAKYEESAFFSLLLIKLTAITYYIMAGVLIFRKIILWLFIAVSPIFPFLFLFYPVRNTGKIWIGEFFRWLLYGPLFAVLLYGLVALWQAGIPLPFNSPHTPADPNVVAEEIYPTAINITLGGPKEILSPANSVNLPETFALYLIALIMLWCVIVFPFILLRIFLEPAYNFLAGDNWLKQQIASRTPSFLKPPPPRPLAPPPIVPPRPLAPPPQVPGAPAGMARELPFTRAYPVQVSTLKTIETNQRILRTTDIKIPTLRDIARFETATIVKDAQVHSEVGRVKDTLSHIANPTTATTQFEKDRARAVRTQLIEEKQKGNPIASSILNAAAGVPGQTALAGLPAAPTTFPAVNRVQSVNLDDYEAVKKMWKENYQKLEPPTDKLGKQKDRASWVKTDIEKIEQAINLLTTQDSLKNKEGMEMVATILPFLLIGGFSQTEVIAYLKAKVEAAKTVLEELAKKTEEEETLLETKEKEEKSQQHLEAEVEEAEDNTPKDSGGTTNQPA